MSTKEYSTGYLNFITSSPHLLAFGFTMTFASSLGQTFFIGCFGPAIQTEFQLSHTSWGSIYMLGTICSALCLPFTGQLIDRFPLKTYTKVAFLGLCLAGLFISINSAAWLLVPIIFCLRHTGQGLTSHVAITTMARYFAKSRGKAVALASLGYACGESFLPLLVVLAIGTIGWRVTYGLMSLVLCIGILPLILWLLRRSIFDNQPQGEKPTESYKKKDPKVLSWTRYQMITNWKFYFLIPAVIAPSFIGTALFSLLSNASNNLRKVIICGGGRKNKVLVEKIKKNTLKNIIIQPIDDYGIDGDFVESQAFAFLAIRSILRLPISFPDTTGCLKPCTGGDLIEN